MRIEKNSREVLLLCLAVLAILGFAYLASLEKRGTTVKHKEKAVATKKAAEEKKAETTVVAEEKKAETSARTGNVVRRGDRATKKTVTRTRTIIEHDATTGVVVREITEREDETVGEEAKVTTETVIVEASEVSEVKEVKAEEVSEAALVEETKAVEETQHEVEVGKLSNFGLATTARLNPMLTYQWKRKGLLSHDLVVEFERKEIPKMRGLGFGQFAEFKKYRAGTYQTYNLKERDVELGIAIGRRF